MSSKPRPSRIKIPGRLLALRRFPLVKLVVPFVMLGIILILGLAVLNRINVGREKAVELAALRADVNQTQARVNQLQRRKRYLQSPEGIKAAAIERGYVEPGDNSVRFTPQQGQPQPSAGATANTYSGDLLPALSVFFGLAFLLGTGLLLYRWRSMRKKRPAGMLTPRSELRKRRRQFSDS